MAAATPPPIHRWLLAALPMASTAIVVMSPRSTLMIVRPMVRSIATSGNEETGKRGNEETRKRGNAHPSQQPSTHSPTERPWFRASAFPRFRVSVSPSVLLAPPVRRHVFRFGVLADGRPATGPLLGHTGPQLIVLPQIGQHLQRVPGGLLDLLPVVQDELEQRIDYPLVAQLAQNLDRQPFDVDVLVFQRADEMFEGRVPKERVDRLQREPPDLRAGILQRLGENLGH